MDQDTTLRSVIYELLSQKIGYFKVFAQVTELKKQNQQTAQFKTEKWLQAELLIHLWSRGVRAIPEYGPTRWDIFVPPSPLNKTAHFLALDGLSDSGQSASKDYEGVKEDIDSVLGHKAIKVKASVVLVLPLAPLSSRRGKYRSAMLGFIHGHSHTQILSVNEQKILFESGSQEGIAFVWIERRNL